MSKKPKLKIMVASSIRYFEGPLDQICGTLQSFGYEVWNSKLGTVKAYPNKSNEESCILAAQKCDVFLGITRGYYGSGVVNGRSITHAEFQAAIAAKKPRWFLVHRDVTCARQLLMPYMFKKDKKTHTKWKLKKNPIISDAKVIDLYHDATQHEVPLDQRKGHWNHDFNTVTEALIFLEAQLKDVAEVEKICNDMRAS